MPGGELYREDIRLPAIGWVAVAMLLFAMSFIALAFIDPFGASSRGDSQSGVFLVPAFLFICLAGFAWFMGKFTIVATDKRLSVGAGMNSNSVAWAEISSAGEDYSRRPSCNVLTAVPSVLNGESVMVYAIGCLPRVELTLKGETLRRLIFPTRNHDKLLEIIRDRTKLARNTTPEIKDTQEAEMIYFNRDRGWPDGVGGPPIFPLP